MVGVVDCEVTCMSVIMIEPVFSTENTEEDEKVAAMEIMNEERVRVDAVAEKAGADVIDGV